MFPFYPLAHWTLDSQKKELYWFSFLNNNRSPMCTVFVILKSTCFDQFFWLSSFDSHLNNIINPSILSIIANLFMSLNSFQDEISVSDIWYEPNKLILGIKRDFEKRPASIVPDSNKSFSHLYFVIISWDNWDWGDWWAYLNRYVCVLCQNRSSKIYPFSFENIQNSPINPSDLVI